MKRLALLLTLIVAAGCARTASTPPPPAPDRNTPGAATPRGAVVAFLSGIKAEDLQALSVIWGTHDGPARDQMERSVLERRELTMACYFRHDTYQILGEKRTDDQHRVLTVSLTKGDLTRQTTFSTVLGPHNRWYVEDGDIVATKDLCAAR